MLKEQLRTLTKLGWVIACIAKVNYSNFHFEKFAHACAMAQGNWMRISIALSQKVTISVRLAGW